MPELDRVGNEPVSAPVGRPGDRSIGEAIFQIRRIVSRVLPGSRSPGSAATPRRRCASWPAGCESTRSDSSALTRSTRPSTRTCRSRSCQKKTSAAHGFVVQLACFAALVVGEKRESALVDPAQQDDPRRRPAVARGRWPASWRGARGSPAFVASSNQRSNWRIGSGSTSSSRRVNRCNPCVDREWSRSRSSIAAIAMSRARRRAPSPCIVDSARLLPKLPARMFRTISV